MSGPYDLFIIGGGINGVGIARDAAGRGLRVCLAEKNDLGGATSSASTKLFHGGLRYLEFFEFGLVKKALTEREALLKSMPHISWPLRFVLPLSPQMRFDSNTPTSRLLSYMMPWMRGRRPAWLIRLGLFLYDHLGSRDILPGTKRLNLTTAPEGAPLKREFRTAFEYSDAWVQDARLVVLNARDAEARGADIMPRTEVLSAARNGDVWRITLRDDQGQREVTAKTLVNAGGPWVADIVANIARLNTTEDVRLVRGSHIVTKRLYNHDKCYFFQGRDGRIIFAIPYEEDFTLLGTTDAEHDDIAETAVCTEEERDYLLDFANQYFARPVTASDVVWSFAGVRPLYDDGASSATATTRDYVLSIDANGPVLLNIFGGKITTYRKLAEQVMAELAPHLERTGADWTAGVALPGGDFAVDGVEDLISALLVRYKFLNPAWAKRLVRHYGTETWEILSDAQSLDDLGQNFGATLTEAELRWIISREFAHTAEDVIWRRTKLGLRLKPCEVAAIERFMGQVHQYAAE